MSKFNKEKFLTKWCLLLQMNWLKASDFCWQRGMELATFHDEYHLWKVSREMPQGKHLWVSASDIGETEGHYYWADGTPVTRTFWYGKNPKLYSKYRDTCVLVWTSYGLLWDYGCNGGLSYPLCSIPKCLAQCLN